MGAPTLTRRERVKLAAQADVDDRTIAKVLRGEYVHGESRERAIDVLVKAGHAIPASAHVAPPRSTRMGRPRRTPAPELGTTDAPTANGEPCR